MKHIILIIAAACSVGNACAQSLQWAYTWGIAGKASRALAVTTDAAVYVYTAGTFKGELD